MTSTGIAPLDAPDLLAYSSNFMGFNNAAPADWGLLSGMLETPWLAARVPLDRHDDTARNAAGNLISSSAPPAGVGGRLAIGFVDTHAEAVRRDGFDRVRISPFQLPVVPR
jgi:hypothetical protein